MKRKLMNQIMTVGCAGALTLATMTAEAAPKYVFFFLGDGMANSQIQATEAYLATVNGGSATNPATLAMNRLLRARRRLSACKPHMTTGR